MNGFFLFTGEQGSGKTIMAVRTAFTERKRRKVFSNCKLNGINYTAIAFDVTKPSNIGKLDIIATLKADTNYFNDSVMIIDECHLYLDSRDWMAKNQRIVQTFFSQLRKRHILLLGTAQSMWNVDIRVRRQCMNVIQMEHIKGSVFTAETDKIDNTGYGAIFVSKYPIDLREYYTKYDTDEVQE